MKLNSWFSIFRENLPESPAWVEYLLSPLNSVIQNIYLALQGNLSIGDNLIGQSSTVQVQTGSTYISSGTFSPVVVPWNAGAKASPSVVLVGRVVKPSNLPAQVLTVSVPSWTYNFSSQSITIPYIAGLADSSSYQITLMIL